MTLSEYLMATDPVIDEEFFYKFAHEKIFFPLGPNSDSYSNLPYNHPEVIRRFPIRKIEKNIIAVFMASNKNKMLTRPFVAIPLIFAVEKVSLSNKYDAMMIYADGDKTVVATKLFLQDVLKSANFIPLPEKTFGLNEHLIKKYEKKEELGQNDLLNFRETKIFCSVMSDTTGKVGKIKDRQDVILSTVRDAFGTYVVCYTDKSDGRLADKVLDAPLYGIAQMVSDNSQIQGMLIYSDQEAWFKLGKIELKMLLKPN